MNVHILRQRTVAAAALALALVSLAGCVGSRARVTPPLFPVYTILEMTVHDDVTYQRYREAVAPIIEAHGGRYLVRSGAARFDPDPATAVVSPEGDWHPDRIIVLEFPSRIALDGFVTSPEYQAVAPLRTASATTRSIVVNGYTGHSTNVDS